MDIIDEYLEAKKVDTSLKEASPNKQSIKYASDFEDSQFSDDSNNSETPNEPNNPINDLNHTEDTGGFHVESKVSEERSKFIDEE